MEELYFLAPSEEHVQREKNKARELRRSQWWKNRRGRGRCHYCGQAVPPRELTMDHVVPLSRGGRSIKSNVVPCCKDCNTRKRYLLPVEWEAYLEHLRQESSHIAGPGAEDAPLVEPTAGAAAGPKPPTTTGPENDAEPTTR